MIRLKSLDLSNFNSEQTTTMLGMFNNCVSLESIIFGTNFGTSNVENMESMFEKCHILEILNTINKKLKDTLNEK